jgi:hypothetical protein
MPDADEAIDYARATSDGTVIADGVPADIVGFHSERSPRLVAPGDLNDDGKTDLVTMGDSMNRVAGKR